MEEMKKPEDANSEMKPETKPEAQKIDMNKFGKLAAPLGIVVVTLILAVAVGMNKDSLSKNKANTATNQVAGANTAGTGAAPSVDIKNIKNDGDPFIGNANAPVTIAYWSDYQCPYCKQFELSTLPSIIQAYVDTGKVKIVFKDFQFLGKDSLTGGLYARAVWDLYPDKFFAWREAMFNAQDGENTGFGDEASVKLVTSKIDGIDVSKVAAQVASKNSQYQAELTADKTEGAQNGITGTPGSITGTYLISGAGSFSAFQADIEAQLK